MIKASPLYQSLSNARATSRKAAAQYSFRSRLIKIRELTAVDFKKNGVHDNQTGDPVAQSLVEILIFYDVAAFQRLY